MYVHTNTWACCRLVNITNEVEPDPIPFMTMGWVMRLVAWHVNECVLKLQSTEQQEESNGSFLM